jgi:hypothetical protein
MEMIVLTAKEADDLGYVLDCVEGDADRMRDADPAAYDVHAEAIDSMLGTCPLSLNEDQQAAVRFLIEGNDWESMLDDPEGMASLRQKLSCH